MSKYEVKFRKDMVQLLKTGMELYRIDEQYTEVRMFLKQFAVIPDHLRYLLLLVILIYITDNLSSGLYRLTYFLRNPLVKFLTLRHERR